MFAIFQEHEDADDVGDDESAADEEANSIQEQINAKEEMLQSVMAFVQSAKDIKQNYEKLLHHIQVKPGSACRAHWNRDLSHLWQLLRLDGDRRWRRNTTKSPASLSRRRLRRLPIPTHPTTPESQG